jgi:hypothetical protein
VSYQIIFSREAEDDLARLLDHLLERKLNSAASDLLIPERALEAIQMTCQLLATTPFSCRKAAASTFHRELVIPLWLARLRRAVRNS